MPRGYYLAQGLVPLGYHSSDDEEGPCELPNGRLVCGPHGLVRCGRCCTDYSFMDDILDEEDHNVEDEDDFTPPVAGPSTTSIPSRQSEVAVSTRPSFPSRFQPRSTTQRPMELFCRRRRLRNTDTVRCTHPDDASALLIMTDGACLNNGQANPKAGWAFIHGLNLENRPLVVSGRLEEQGPRGDDCIQSSNRAELRAVIAALGFRHWPDEGFNTVVIATDSEYVVKGSTQWAKTWVKNDWKTKNRNGHGRASVKNRDLWETLLEECTRAQRNGLVVKFWHIPREWNTLADEGAKMAAALASPTPPQAQFFYSGLAINWDS